MMNEREARVGIRELKAHLSRYLREVERGSSLTVTDRGRPIARILPAGASLEERLQAMVDAGLANWSGEVGTLEDFEPLIKIDEGRTVSELLLEDRR